MKFFEGIWDYFFSFKNGPTGWKFLLKFLNPLFFIAFIVGFSFSFIFWAPFFANIKIFDLSLAIIVYAGGLILLYALFIMSLISIFIKLLKIDLSFNSIYYRLKEYKKLFRKN